MVIQVYKNRRRSNKFRFDLSEIERGNSKNKSKEQLNKIESIKNFYKSREEVARLYNDYARIMPDAGKKAKNGTGLKILTLKQMLQILPKALAQVKAGNNSENLLN